MSIESDLVTALTTVVGAGRVFRGPPPQGVTVLPRITYQHVGGTALNFVERAVPGKRNARVQVNGWASSPLAADTLCQQIENTLRVVTTLQVSVLGARVDMDEPANTLYGSRQDYSLWG